ANIGRWPWSRDIHAKLIEFLIQGQAKVIGQTVFFLEPQLDPGLMFIQNLTQFYADSSLKKEAAADIELLNSLLGELANKAPTPGEKTDGASFKDLLDFVSQSSLAGRLSSDINTLENQLLEADTALDTDGILSGAIAMAGNVVLAMPLVMGEPQGNPDEELPQYVLRNSLLNVDDRVGAVDQGLFPLPTIAAIPPIPDLGEPALAIGHLNSIRDVDEGVRVEPLVLLHYDAYIPSLALQLAASSLNLKQEDIQVHLGEGVQLGRLKIATDGNLLM
ncbi:MAG: CHASE2 domain-containing protein, partial [Gammaproteobacteria bacterium]|nr:CHASE2 domain-containing protein [Gammaproteobacteria bacterium]